ncbi:hypothetical protein WICMUC_000992 [Wickerhamomyces mucosus]|uniref:Coatomer subunit delta n=1 Tax=Wickerhamomyces mucosus TaxID=1378264 RepID=A0A9P8PWH6_9ASCO|nr:hypothetical protein WICMUC_000992 [Wickerhamomyces mucosus]
MAVLAASIITRSGKAILSRQFKDLTKNRVTELLANFPSLLSENNTQHTTVEDDQVRYVYQPLDELYIILITNRQSNILQDIGTLNLFSETVTSILRVINEHEIFEHAFEILSAFDEIVTLGYKENLSLLQIKTFLEMDSHEEKIQEIIERNKELEATEERKRRAKEIQRRELERRAINSSSGFGGNNNFSPQAGYPSTDLNRVAYEQAPQSYVSAPVEPEIRAKPVPKGRGLQLGKSNKKTLSDPSAEPLIAPSLITEQSSQQQYQAPIQQEKPQHQSNSKLPQQQQQEENSFNNGILVTLEEKISAEITREGSIISSELKGVLQLRINDQESAFSKILLGIGEKSNDIQFKTHPNVDRQLFSSDSIIGLKDPKKPFPSNDQNLGVLRWRGVGKADDNKFIPIQFSSWLSTNGDLVDVTLEFELTDSYPERISDIIILVPISTENVELNSGQGQILKITEEGVFFQVDSLSPGEQGVLEFSIEAESEERLFPIEVWFKNVNAVNTLGKVKVLDIVNSQDEESLKFDLISELTTESYQIV